MAHCLDFAMKKAIIFHQSDYSLTHLSHPHSFGNLEATKKIAINAKHIARGFGIVDKDITLFEDMPVERIDKEISGIKQQLLAVGKKGKRAFLFVYCTGHRGSD